jgi:Protein of unknown function (DUF3987)/RepB DNA-primase from phage plasmid
MKEGTASVHAATVREFLQIISDQAKAATAGLERPGLLQLSRLHPTDEKLVPSRFEIGDVEHMVQAGVADSEAGHNVYIEGRTVREDLRGNGRGKLEDTRAVFAIVIDSDADKQMGWTPTVPPSLTVATSPGNFQYWFFLREAVSAEVGKKLGERVRKASNSDHDTGNAVQPYRVAGTVNFPGKKKIERGRVTVPTHLLVFDPEVLWTPETIEQAFLIPEHPAIKVGVFVQWISGGVEQLKPPRQVTKIDASAGYAWVDGNTGIPINELTVVTAAGTADEASIPAETRKVIRDGLPANVSNKDRSNAFWNVVKEDGWSSDGIVALLEKYPDGIAQKYHGRLQREVERDYGKIKIEAASEQPEGPIFDPWERYIVPAFPFDILPTAVQDFVATQATVIGCCPSATAMAALGTFSGALHHGFAIKMLRDATWYEHVRLWILLVAEASQRKTPLLKAVSAPLVQYEKHLRQNFEYALHAYHIAQEEDAASQMTKPEPPPRYLVWDTTTEKLGELLARNGEKGILVLTDEISGWLGSMERYNSSGSRADRAFWLSAYDGGPRTVDRIKRGELYIPNLSASILGGIQPARLAEIQGLTSDGLLQRFVPVMMSSAKFRQDRVSEDAAYGALVRELIFAKPARLIMTDDALAIMADLHQHLFELEQSSEGLAAGFSSFVGKLHGLTGSLALILHLIQDPQLGAAYPVGEQTIDNVRRLTLDFILPHAFEFYRGTEATEGDRLRRLASWILTNSKQRILASDLTTNVRDLRGLTLPEVNERVSPLVAGGWLQPADKTPACSAWTVAPQVRSQLAERVKSEAARKTALAAALFNPARKAPP